MVFTIAFLAAQTPPGGLPSSEEHLELPLGITAYENWGAVRGSRAWLSGVTLPRLGRARNSVFLRKRKCVSFDPQARQDRTGTRRLSARHDDGMVSVVKKR